MGKNLVDVAFDTQVQCIYTEPLARIAFHFPLSLIPWSIEFFHYQLFRERCIINHSNYFF